MSKFGIKKYFSKGTFDVFIDGLPGLPDNLKADGNGGFLVPLLVARDEEHPCLFQSIAPFPLIRKAIARLMGTAKLLFQTIDKYYPNEVSLKIIHYVSFITFDWFLTGLSVRVCLDRTFYVLLQEANPAQSFCVKG